MVTVVVMAVAVAATVVNREEATVVAKVVATKVTVAATVADKVVAIRLESVNHTDLIMPLNNSTRASPKVDKEALAVLAALVVLQPLAKKVALIALTQCLLATSVKWTTSK